MTRDGAQFPNDDTGEALWLAQQHGKDLSQEHEVRFAVLFPEEASALKFGLHLLRQGYWVQVNEYSEKPEFTHEVLADIYIPTTHGQITGAEQWLAESSASLGGKNDGWSFGGKSSGIAA